MLHLNSKEGIAYLGRLGKEIQGLIKRFEGEREIERANENKSKIMQYAPLSFYFLNALVSRQQELLEYYSQNGYGKNGLHISPSGFPSAPSLLADIKSIKENLLEAKINELNPLIEKDKQSLGNIESRLRELDLESLPDLKPIENHKNKLEQEKYSLECESEFFSRLLRESNNIEFRSKGKSKSTFKLSIFDDKDDKFFYLTESAKKLPKEIEEGWKGYGDYKGSVNVLRARYLDTSVYSLDNPVLIIATQGNKVFSNHFSFNINFNHNSTHSRTDNRLDIMIQYPNFVTRGSGNNYEILFNNQNSPIIFTSNIKDNDTPNSFKFPGKMPNDYSSKEEERIRYSKEFFLNLFSVFPEEVFSTNGHKTNPEEIFSLYRAVCGYRDIIDPISGMPKGNHLSSALEKLDTLKELANIIAQDTTYGAVARDYLKSYKN